MRHGDEIEVDKDPDSLPDWWQEDPDMWYGLSTSMSEYLSLTHCECEALCGCDDDGYPRN